MSLAVASALHARLVAELARIGSPLAVWRLAHASPALVIGMPTRDAESAWPFIAVLPNSYTKDLRTDDGTAASALLVIGYLAPADEAQADAMLASEALADAALEAIRMPFSMSWSRLDWDASTAERTQITLEHPYYETQLAITMGRLKRS